MSNFRNRKARFRFQGSNILAGIPRNSFLRPIRFVFRKLLSNQKRHLMVYIYTLQLCATSVRLEKEHDQDVAIMSSEDKNSIYNKLVKLNCCIPSKGVILCFFRQTWEELCQVAAVKGKDSLSLSVSEAHEASFVISHHFQYRTPFRFQWLFISTRKASCRRLKIPLFILQRVDSEDEVSESEETVEELPAIGNDHDTSEDSDNESLKKNEASTYAPIRNICGIEGALFSVTQTYPLPSLPSTSLEYSTLPGQNGGGPSSHQSGSLVTGRSDGQRIPVQSKLEESRNLCLNLLWFAALCL